MLPSVPSANVPNIVSLPLLSDHTTNSKQDQDLILPFPLYNFPLSPFSLYPEEDRALYLQPLTGHSLPNTNTNMIEPSKQFFDVNGLINNKSKHNQSQIIFKKMVPRKRSTKKDRHSKINTIHGLRDRRMRLSLEVARKFFDLQDMLGFDKASKTVDWLLTQSNSAIKELSKNFSSSYNLASERAWESSPSECDMISGVIDESGDAFHDRDQMEKAEDDPVGFQLPPDSGKARKTSRSQPSTRRISSAQLARESREKARARAKERTREKMSLQKLIVTTGSKPFEIVEESGTSQSGHNNMKLPSMEVRAEVDEQKQFGAIGEKRTEDPFTITSNYLQSVGTFQDSQFRDFQLFLKPWEAYGGTSYLC